MRFEKLKPAYVALKKSNAAWQSVHQQDSLAYAYQSSVVNWYKASFAVEQELRQDADRKVLLWRGKARRRGWIIGVGIGLPVLYGAYQILK